MEQNTWSSQQINIIETLTQDFSPKQINKYHINWLKRLITKAESFQNECTTCKDLCVSVETIITELEHIKVDSKYNASHYFDLLNHFFDHLKKQHKIVEQRHYMNRGVIIGVILGIFASLIMKYFAPEQMQYGLYVGVLAGFIIGLQLDKKAISENRVL